jgi:hypothetical protein
MLSGYYIAMANRVSPQIIQKNIAWGRVVCYFKKYGKGN